MTMIKKELYPSLAEAFCDRHALDIHITSVVENYSIEQALGQWFNKNHITRRGQSSAAFQKAIVKLLEERLKEYEPTPAPPVIKK